MSLPQLPSIIQRQRAESERNPECVVPGEGQIPKPPLSPWILITMYHALNISLTVSMDPIIKLEILILQGEMLGSWRPGRVGSLSLVEKEGCLYPGS